MFEAEVNPSGIDRAELVVSIPSYNEADTITRASLQASEGLIRYFPDRRSVLINCDNNSPDRTKDVFLGTPARVPKIYISTPPEIRGKGNNLRNLFRKAVELEAKAIVVVDADVQTLTPEWIRHLGEPLFKGFSYVAPLYVQHKYDNPVNNAVAYPLSRALFGTRIRQPIGGDFGMTGELARCYLKSDLWNDAVAGFGIGIWMTILALNQRAQVCQSFVGRPKIHRTRVPAALVFRQVMGTIFSLISRFDSQWLSVRHSKPTAVFGFQHGEPEAPPKVAVDGERLFSKCHESLRSYGEVWEQILSPDVFNKLLEILGMEKSVFDFPTDLWARILFDSAVSHRGRVCDPDLMIDSLLPLFFGKTLAFVRKTTRMSARQVEEAIEEECAVFEMAKPYLAKRWLGKSSKQ